MRHLLGATAAAFAAAVIVLLPLIWHHRDVTRVQLSSQQTTLEMLVRASATAAQISNEQASHATTSGRVIDPGLFAAQPGSLALDVSGDVRVTGQLTVDGDILLNGRSIGSFLTSLMNQGRAACGSVPCIHGFHEFLRTCRCVCESGWSGQACDRHQCNGNGLWNAALQRCDCTPPFEASTQCRFQLCRGVMATQCPPLYESGCDTPGAFADNCSDVCAAPQGCSRRANWGRALAPSLGYRVGICGGGFVLAPGGDAQPMDGFVVDDDRVSVRIGAMVCSPLATVLQCVTQFNVEAPYCCAPGAECGEPACADMSCCAQRLRRDSCLAAGCAWASGRVCMLPAIADTSTDCELPLLANTAGSWSYYSSTVSGKQTARDRYAQIYTDACGTVAPVNASVAVNSTCLAAAYAAVNADAWPELAADAMDNLASFTLETANHTVGECDGMLCLKSRGTAGARFHFVAAAALAPTAWQTAHSSGYLLTRVSTRLMCVVSSRLPLLLALQLYREGIPLTSADGKYCGVYVLPINNTLYDEDGTRVLTLDASGKPVWGVSAPLTLRVQPVL